MQKKHSASPWRRLLSLCLALTMCLSLLPTAALAAEVEVEPDTADAAPLEETHEHASASGTETAAQAEAPEEQEAEAPEEQEAEAPEEQEAEAPEEQEAEVPEEQQAQAPEEQQAQAPEEQETETVLQDMPAETVTEEAKLNIVAQGDCNEAGTVHWSFDDETGALTITGKGPIEQYGWGDYRDSIRSIQIGEGITYICDYAFGYCYSLADVTIPASVAFIGDDVFYAYDQWVDEETGEWITSYFPQNLNIVTPEFSHAWFYAKIHQLTCQPTEAVEVEALADLNGTEVTMGNYSSVVRSFQVPESGRYDLDSSPVDAAVGSSWSTRLWLVDSNGKALNNYAWEELRAVYLTAGETYYLNDNACVWAEDPITFKLSVTPTALSGEYEGIAWAFAEETDTLTISGSGPMTGSAWSPLREAVKKVEIKEGVTSIGDADFSSFRNLKSVDIPASVTSIGYNAFTNCDSLKSVEIPAGVTSIGDGAFYNCHSLTSVEIPATVTSIGAYTFYDCDSLTSVEIPATVTSIGAYTFYDCDSLTSVEIPATVTSIGSNAFADCDSLESMEIPAGVTSIGDHVFYDCDSLKSVEIPAGVTSIGDGAFYNCHSLTSVEIPATVTSIGDGAFYDCDSLKSVEIPATVTRIGDDTFYDCDSLKSVEIPATVTEIADDAFENCVNLRINGEAGSAAQTFAARNYFPFNDTLPAVDNVIGLGEQSFQVIPGSMVYYAFTAGQSGKYSFSWSFRGDGWFSYFCLRDKEWKQLDSWDEVNLKAGDTVYLGGRVGNGTDGYELRISVGFDDPMAGKTLAGAIAPGETKDAQIEGETIVLYSFIPEQDGTYLFYSTGELDIAGSIFDADLDEIARDLDSGTDWNFRVKRYLYAGETYYLGARLEFGGSATVPVTLEQYIPQTSGQCGRNLDWSYDEGSKTLTITGTGEMDSAPWREDYRDQIETVVMPDGITSIYSAAFEGCESLASVTIPAGVTRIGYSAFRGCAALVSVTIPESITSIGDWAFIDCTSLTSVTLPSGLRYLGSDAFSSYSWDEEDWRQTPGLTIHVSEHSAAHYLVRSQYTGYDTVGEYSVPALPDTITFANDGLSIYTVTPAVDGRYALVFDDSANVNCTILGSDFETVIADGYRSVVADLTGGTTYYVALNEYTDDNEHSITFDFVPTEGDFSDGLHWSFAAESGKLVISGTGEMEYCPWQLYYQNDIKSVEIKPGVTSIAYRAFDYCDSLESVTIPESVTYMKGYAFCGCSSLQEVEIPESVTYMEGYAFFRCSSLQKVEIPSSMRSIGWGVFDECRSLATVTIGEGISSMEKSCFRYCNNLASVTIPASVSVIESEMFFSEYEQDGEWQWGNPPGLTIYGYENTRAQTFAEEQKIPFKAIGKADFGTDNVYYGDVTGNATRIQDMNNAIAMGETKQAETKIRNTSAYYSFTPETDGVYLFTSSGNASIYLYEYMDGDAPIRIAKDKGSLNCQLYAGKTYWVRAVLPSGAIGTIDVTLSQGITSGTHSNGIRWSYSEGTLTLSGNGPVCEKGWGKLQNSITSVVFEEGITGVEIYGLFSRAENLSSVTIPSTMKDLGGGTFSRTNLHRVTIPASVEHIGQNAFQRIGNLEINFQGAVPAMEYNTFWCDNVIANYTNFSDAVGGYYGAYHITWNGWDLAGAEISIVPQTFTGQALTPDVTVTLNNHELKLGTDFTITPATVTDAGEHNITVTAAADSNYAGSKTGTFKVEPCSINGATVNAPAQTYTGNALTPAITVTLNGKELVSGQDYTFKPATINGAGKNAIQITGTGNYKDSIKTIFEVNKAGQDVTVTGSAEMETGTSQTLTVTGSGAVSFQSSDTNVAVVNENGVVTAENPGNAAITVNVAGDNNHEPGTATYNIKVNAISLAGAQISAPAQTYTGKDLTAAVTVNLNGKTLSEGSDYTISNTTFKNAGNYSIQVTGVGRYKDTASGTFTVKKANQKFTVTTTSVAKGKTVKIAAKDSFGALKVTSGNKKIATVSGGSKVKGVAPGKVTLTVKAAGDANHNGATAKVQFNVYAQATPKAPKLEVVNGGVTVTAAKAKGVAKYRIYVKAGNGNWKKKADSKSNVYTCKGLKSGTTYSFSVQYLDAKGKVLSDYSKTGSSTLYLGAPVLTKAVNTKTKATTVSWKKMSGMSGFQIQYSTNNTFKAGVKSVTVKKGTATSQVISKLAVGKTYYFRIRTYQTVNKKTVYSGWSAAKSVTIKK